ncbi:MAG TPA: protein kinase [Vicinamibacteria bacterium]|jgi:Tol biopolymer transport system component/predicted Ser/Thr protein kinase
MSLAVGHRLGAYEILAPIGAGGMGEVYRARDTRLGREVAIKVLPADRLADESRKRRFQQEARAASALNHPHIVTVHEIESADGMDFLVMEYVPGKTLDALVRARMSLADTLRIAIPIADALACAHAAGIVHRDLKPRNVVVTPGGAPKVLDFGLAKLTVPEPSSGERDTLSEETRERFQGGPARLAGTPGYMSPEQVAGGPVDARSDIFAFGCVLYEMVTGRRAFSGNSQVETLTAVLAAPPKPPSELVSDLPRDLEKIIQRCLRKEPEKRFQHMADVKVELEEVLDDVSSPIRAAVGRPWLRFRPGAALLLAAAAATAILLVRNVRAPQPPMPRIVPLTASQGDERDASFSPDGTQVAFAWDAQSGTAPALASLPPTNWDIWLKIIGSSEVRRLTSDPASEQYPAWSPDGRQIAFVRYREGAGASVHLVSPMGGAERRVADVLVAPSQIAWSPDGRWLALRRRRGADETATGIYLVPLQEGEPRSITVPQPSGYDAYPAFSPEGRRLAYSSCGAGLFPPCNVHVVEVGADFAPTGPPRPLTRQAAGIVGLTWTRDGRSIVYSSAHVGQDRARLWRVAASGEELPERLEFVPPGALNPAVAPALERLAFTHSTFDVDIHRFEPGRPSRAIVVSSFPDYAPTFSPDGRRIAFESGRSGERQEIWLADADGSNATQLTHGPGHWQGTPRFSPDGRLVAFESRGDDGYADVWVVDAEGGVPRRITDGPLTNGMASFSRDGRFLYFRADHASGRDISRVPLAGGAPQRLTRDGGLLARESPDGRSLFYTQRDGSSPLLRLELPNGPARKVVDCVQGRSLADGPDAMYYLGCVPVGADSPLYRLDAKSGRSQLLGTLAAAPGNVGLAVSPDSATVLFVAPINRGADLMLIENFR